MSIFDVLSLFGGLAMFLYGMRLMGDSLKENSSGTLKSVLENVTDNPVKAFLLGLLITAVIQSSTATIVITSGLVGAGILTLHQSLGIIIGANVGTTVTGQIIRLLDINASGNTFLRLLQPSTLAPIALIIGIVLIMGGRFKNAKSVGNIAIGFGILFSGLLNMTNAVKTLSDTGIFESLFSKLSGNPVIGYGIGALVAFILQSSSATIGILQAFSTSGILTFKAIYAVIVGIYLGDCVTTAIVCSIGAKAEAKRVGVVNILFNLSETVAVLLFVTAAKHLGLLEWIWDKTANAGMIANTNTVFNLACAVCLFPLISWYEKMSRRIIRDEPVAENRYKVQMESLSPAFYSTPALALRSCYDILLTMLTASRSNLTEAEKLFENYDEDRLLAIEEEEQNINLLTDNLSRYMVGLLPRIHGESFVPILDQYYGTVSEFENLGDHAKDIAQIAADMNARKLTFSDAANKELNLLYELCDRTLDKTQKAFERRDITEAEGIEPMTHAAGDVIGAMRSNHLSRMSAGKCDIAIDADFMNLLTCFSRIFDVCSNVGMSVIVRMRPELADQEHNYMASLRAGADARFNAAYAHEKENYLKRIERIEKEEN